jgi:hypothetical protein
MKGVLGPQGHLDIGRDLGLDSRSFAGRLEPLEARARPPVELPEDEPGGAAGVANDTRLGDPGKDVSGAAGDVLGAERRSQLLLVVDPVLERDDGRVRTDEAGQDIAVNTNPQIPVAFLGGHPHDHDDHDDGEVDS